MADKDRGAGISLLVPYRDDNENTRADNWAWLQQYWQNSLPEAEIITGDAPGEPFSKTCAVNAAFRQSTGDVLVMIDADCYLAASVVLKCAAEIRKGRERGPPEPVWFVPYRHFYRLTGEATLFLLASDPKNPFPFSDPPDRIDVGPRSGNDFGHWFGALVQMFPREAFELVHGMDARMRGWGAEDVCMKLALDTLFGVHRLSSNNVLTLWHTVHSIPGTNPNLLRVWEGQSDPRNNWRLGGKYRMALRDPEAMRGVIDEWLNDPSLKQYRID